jgi:ceramide glucosyltransferase
MEWYCYIALAAILSQLLFLFHTCKNYRYALQKYERKRTWQHLRAVIIIPCKGLEPDFQKNITSFFHQEYENHLLWFVVADKSDPAYDVLCNLKNQLSQVSKAREVRILIAGTVGHESGHSAKATSSASSQIVGQEPEGPDSQGNGHVHSQKIHNLLYCYERIDDDVEFLAFADSDICVRSDWLSHLVWPLRQAKTGAASGYRWFIPKKNNLASLALSAVNAKIAQLLGAGCFNQAWGGSMAIRVEVFRKVGLDKIWPKVLSDDLSLTYAVKKAGLKVVFIPACLAASYESSTWKELFEFGRRQFLITRIYAPGTWLFGLLSSLYSILGLWAGAALAVYAAIIQHKNTLLFAAVPIVFFVSQLVRAILRQKMINKLLKKWPLPCTQYSLWNCADLPKSQIPKEMKAAMVADILAFWAWTLLLFTFIISSAFGRTIRWRGIRYKLLSPTETIVIDS